MGDRRVVSLLPAATEIVCELGLFDCLVGVTHECNYPAGVERKPHVVRSAVDFAGMEPAQIDRVVAERMGRGLSLYEIDERLLAELSPELIITQDLCQVCAPSGNELSQALKSLDRQPQIVWCSPNSIADIEQNIRDIGAACQRTDEADLLIKSMNLRLNRIRDEVRNISGPLPRVLFLEWIDPPFCAGHWVPEMIEIAGGEPLFGRLHENSVRIAWEEIIDTEPEVIVLSPCGYDLQRTLQQSELLIDNPFWQKLPAVNNGRVYAVDADSYFARPGPRIVDGVELLAHIFHPKSSESKRVDSFYRISASVSN